MARPPKTYDEITRKTIPDPDSSFRPTPEQLDNTRRGILAMDDEERALLAQVRGAVARFPNISVSVEQRRVTVSGGVSDAATMQQVREAVGRIDDIELIDQLHVGS